MPKRRRGAAKRKGRAYLNAELFPHLSRQELQMRLATEALLDKVRDVAGQIDHRVRTVLGQQELHDPDQSSQGGAD